MWIYQLSITSIIGCFYLFVALCRVFVWERPLASSMNESKFTLYVCSQPNIFGLKKPQNKIWKIILFPKDKALVLSRSWCIWLYHQCCYLSKYFITHCYTTHAWRTTITPSSSLAAFWGPPTLITFISKFLLMG